MLHFKYNAPFHAACHSEEARYPSTCQQCCITSECNVAWMDTSLWPNAISGVLDTDAEWESTATH